MAQDLVIKPPREAGATRVTDLTPSFYTRFMQGFQYVFGGKVPDYFGPREALPPQAPDSVAGRQMDYPVGYNINVTPKAGEGIGFGVLKWMSEAWPLLRLVIETRKDQLCQMEWNIVPRNKAQPSDEKCKKLEAFFRFPDREHSWDEWLRMILEDMLVTDTACLYPRPTRDGSLYALEPIDGTTIKRLIDDYGRTPDLPTAAYQQILKGMPANDYNRDQLIYKPRNLRSGKIYGFSHVEQILLTIQIALNRENSTLSYYTQGSTPDLILSVPETWTPDQIRVFKMWWDSILAGNVPAKRGTMFVFNGMKPLNTKDRILADEMDEWLARQVCFCFGMSPQPFIQNSTRASAVTAATAAKEEGINPSAKWVTNLMNYILTKYCDGADYKFMFAKDQETDHLTRTQVNNLKTRAGAMSIDEWRASDGQEPLPDGKGTNYLVYTAQGAMTLDDAIEFGAEQLKAAQAGSEGAEGEPRSSGGTKSPSNSEGRMSNTQQTQARGTTNKKPESRTARMGDGRVRKSKEPRPITDEEIGLADSIAFGLRKMEQQVFADLVKQGVGEKGDLRDADVVVASLSFSTKPIADSVSAAVETRVTDAFAKATAALAKSAETVATTDAKAYAAARAAELVTRIDETTRLLIRELVAKAIDEEWPKERLAKELADDFAFSPSRASTIASTEMNDALTHAELQAWIASGLVKSIEWTISATEGVCAVCTENENAGQIALGETFPSGDDGPPAHPNCRCGITPVIEED